MRSCGARSSHAAGERVIFRSARVSADDLARATRWHLRAEGLCSGDRCVPFRAEDRGAIDLAAVARALGRPLVHDEQWSLYALGAETGAHALATASMPELALPDVSGRPFDLASLRGQKVLLVAWASW